MKKTAFQLFTAFGFLVSIQAIAATPVAEEICKDPVLAQNELALAPESQFSQQKALGLLTLPEAKIAAEKMISAGVHSKFQMAFELLKQQNSEITAFEALKDLTEAGCKISQRDYKNFIIPLTFQRLSGRQISGKNFIAPNTGKFLTANIKFKATLKDEPIPTTLSVKLPQVEQVLLDGMNEGPYPWILHVYSQNAGAIYFEVMDRRESLPIGGHMAIVSFDFAPSLEFFQGRILTSTYEGAAKGGEFFGYYNRYLDRYYEGAKAWLELE